MVDGCIVCYSRKVQFDLHKDKVEFPKLTWVHNDNETIQGSLFDLKYINYNNKLEAHKLLVVITLNLQRQKTLKEK